MVSRSTISEPQPDSAFMPLYNSQHEQTQSKITYIHFPFKGVIFANSYFPYLTRKSNSLPKKHKQKNVDDFKLN